MLAAALPTNQSPAMTSMGEPFSEYGCTVAAMIGNVEKTTKPAPSAPLYMNAIVSEKNRHMMQPRQCAYIPIEELGVRQTFRHGGAHEFVISENPKLLQGYYIVVGGSEDICNGRDAFCPVFRDILQTPVLCGSVALWKRRLNGVRTSSSRSEASVWSRTSSLANLHANVATGHSPHGRSVRITTLAGRVSTDLPMTSVRVRIQLLLLSLPTAPLKRLITH